MNENTTRMTASDCVCQHCRALLAPPWTLCTDCRREYARILHRLRSAMLLLQAVSRREYRLGDGAGGTRAGDEAPTPVSLHALDLLDRVEDTLQDVWHDTGATWTDRWQRLIPRMQAHMGDLCRAPHAGVGMARLADACERIGPLVDRTPRTRRIVGVCPECGREVMAARGETLRVCRCGAVIDVERLRAECREQVERVHLTRTPAGMSEWLRESYGYEVGRKQIANWLNRGKLPSSKPVGGGYWEFNVREILALAMGATRR